jgi:hypothetical protein
MGQESTQSILGLFIKAHQLQTSVADDNCSEPTPVSFHSKSQPYPAVLPQLTLVGLVVAKPKIKV